MEWETVKRPGFFGKRKEEIFRQYDEEYGEGDWRIAWQYKGIVGYETACGRYENAYCADSFRREGLWKELISVAKNVYDHDESDIHSGLSYLVQNGTATHIQDIAIRRVVILRRDWEFKGDKLVQIRSHADYWGRNLSPGKVPFHQPELIVVPHLEGWWDYNSVEDFYQSNKVLQVNKKVLQAKK
jgi:hypothetical protein